MFDLAYTFGASDKQMDAYAIRMLHRISIISLKEAWKIVGNQENESERTMDKYIETYCFIHCFD